MATILVIDDEESMRTSLKTMLTREGYDVLAAEDGKKGLELFTSHQVDLVITDIVMPEKEGLETIMEMQKASRDVKIIAISGGGRLEPAGYLYNAKALGAKHTFEKPFKQADLLGAVYELLKDEGA